MIESVLLTLLVIALGVSTVVVGFYAIVEEDSDNRMLAYFVLVYGLVALLTGWLI